MVSTSLSLSPLITFVIKSILLALLLSCLSTYAADETVKTAQVATPSTIVWPTQMASKIYILPVKIDPAAITDAKKKNEEGISILPSDDEEETKKKLTELKTDLTAAILEKMKDAELPAQIWTSSSPLPADGWKLEGNVVNLDPGKKVLGTDNPVVGIVISVADANHPITEPFLVYSSAKAKMSPGPGLSPFAKIGNMIAKGTGLQESMQIGRLAESVTERFGESMETHGLKKKDD